MADYKRVLGVGDRMVLRDISDSLFELSNGRLVMSAMTTDVTSTIAQLNQESYSGVVLTDLVLPSGAEHEKYNALAKEFERFDSPPNIWFSGGLYVVKYSIGKGVKVALQDFSLEKEVLEEARKLGAKTFSLGKTVFEDVYRIVR